MSISEALYAWLAILVLPINSALNPILYTLTTTVFIKQVRIINEEKGNSMKFRFANFSILDAEDR